MGRESGSPSGLLAGFGRLVQAVFTLPVHFILAAVGCIATLAFVAWLVPFEIPGILHSYLIYFIHLPNAINYLVFFLIGGVFSLLYLVKRDMKYDVYAQSALGVSIVACTTTICTGSPWARAAWGHWWIWDDPRLLTVAISWFFLASYHMLRWAVPELHKRARYAAVFGIVATLNVPAVHYAIRVLPSRNHPMDVEEGLAVGITVETGIISILLLYLLIFRLLVRTERASRELEECRRVVYEI